MPQSNMPHLHYYTFFYGIVKNYAIFADLN